MITIGHSFGGALVYSAMETLLVRELHGSHIVGLPAEKQIKPVRKGVGDLVVLVNPAFEAERYRLFAEDMLTRGQYASDQLPVMLTVASENDRSVGILFPIGRALWLSGHPLLWHHALLQTEALGHYPSFVTHHLKFDGTHQGKVPSDAKRISPEVVESCNLADEIKHHHVREHCNCTYDVGGLHGEINP